MAKPSLIIHEISPTSQHRVVLYTVTPAGTVQEAGKWAEAHELAVNGTYVANSGHVQGLPLGVFTVQQIPYDILS